MCIIDGNTIIPDFGISTDGSQSKALILAIYIRRELIAKGNILREKHPDEINLNLAIRNDGAIGFLSKSTNNFYLAFEKTSNSTITQLFSRLLREVNIPKHKKFKEFIVP